MLSFWLWCSLFFMLVQLLGPISSGLLLMELITPSDVNCHDSYFVKFQLSDNDCIVTKFGLIVSIVHLSFDVLFAYYVSYIVLKDTNRLDILMKNLLDLNYERCTQYLLAKKVEGDSGCLVFIGEGVWSIFLKFFVYPIYMLFVILYSTLIGYPLLVISIPILAILTVIKMLIFSADTFRVGGDGQLIDPNVHKLIYWYGEFGEEGKTFNLLNLFLENCLETFIVYSLYSANYYSVYSILFSLPTMFHTVYRVMYVLLKAFLQCLTFSGEEICEGCSYCFKGLCHDVNMNSNPDPLRRALVRAV